ncbi:MAG: DUF1566 domain-containing protein [Deltaproteobacteria bacterium]|nr:DUF1566 domain-containing protein [Deltaproteobacteria bacterium]
MKRKELTWIFGCFALLFFTAIAWTAPVPDTGQTTCYDVAGNVITCPSPGQPLYGQDANYTINPMSFTKLDGTGNALQDFATSWVMVRDNVTGLIWEMKTNKDGNKDYSNPHDADNVYTWYDPTDPNPGTPGDGTDTKDFIDTLNGAHFGGYSDWRLPTVNELASIVNYSISSPGPTIDTGYFPNTQASFYWSSTTYALNMSSAWGVFFDYGGDSNNFKYYSLHVRAVRGGQAGSSNNYTDNGDGTVTDTSTGLVWQQATANSRSWEEALSYCATLNLGNNTDWRLPTIRELRSLVDYNRYNPAINMVYFTGTLSSYYWTSTTDAYSKYGAWSIGLYNGDDSKDFKDDSHNVRAVRGGQANSTPSIKANGQNGPITVSSGTPVSITAGLASGNENGKLADWWLAYSSPAGWYSLNSNGWTPGINLLAQYPLFSISPVAIYSSTLPVGDYAFYFLVDMSPNGIVDSPYYYDVVQVHVVN